MPNSSSTSAATDGAAPPLKLSVHHRRRLRALWRSAGWPCHDVLEAELIAAGLLERREDAHGRVTLRVTDAGVDELVRATEGNRSARSAHDGLVARVAATLARDGRLAWCGLSLRAQVSVDPPAAVAAPFTAAVTLGLDPSADPAADPGPGPAAAPAGRWQMAMPDVFSIRQTSVPAYLMPVVHEIKVRRADLLADLRQPAKRAAYLQMAGALFYVLAEGVGDADDVPPECGVLLARGPLAEHAERSGEPVGLEMLRNAPARTLAEPGSLPFAVWMALARRTPHSLPPDEQLSL